MSWNVEFLDEAKRDMKRLDHSPQVQVFKELPYNARSTLTGEFQPPAACKFLDLPPASLRNLQFAFD